MTSNGRWSAGDRLAVVALVSLATACATARGDSTAAIDPLGVPEAPPRTVAAPVTEAEPSMPVPVPVEEPEPPEEEPSSPEPGTVVAPRPAAPEPERRLRSAQAGEPSRAARAARDTLDRVETLLGVFDRTELSRSDRAQYDTALQFAELAEAALSVDNVMFANYLADKAATLAESIGGG